MSLCRVMALHSLLAQQGQYPAGNRRPGADRHAPDGAPGGVGQSGNAEHRPTGHHLRERSHGRLHGGGHAPARGNDVSRHPHGHALWCALLGLALVSTSACTVVQAPRVDMAPMPSGRVAALQSVPPPLNNGAIFQTGASRGYFEDRQARQLGDILSVRIEENMSASQTSASSLGRSATADANLGALPFLKAGTLGKLGVKADSANSFEGKGTSNSANNFSGVITVTVSEVLPNGHLVVAGEKQIGINQNVEVLKFTGIVDPATIQAGNTVSSTQVADARMLIRGVGDSDRSQSVGWLQRLFMAFSPI